MTAAPEVRRPASHLFVVTDHGDGEWCTGVEHVGGHGADQLHPVLLGQGGPEPALRLMEGLDGDQDDRRAQRRRGQSPFGRRRGRPRHRVSVRGRAAGCGAAVGSRYARPGGGDRSRIVGHGGGLHRGRLPPDVPLGALARPGGHHATTRQNETLSPRHRAARRPGGHRLARGGARRASRSSSWPCPRTGSVLCWPTWRRWPAGWRRW